jgi:hypothetical protein
MPNEETKDEKNENYRLQHDATLSMSMTSNFVSYVRKYSSNTKMKSQKSQSFKNGKKFEEIKKTPCDAGRGSLMTGTSAR